MNAYEHYTKLRTGCLMMIDVHLRTTPHCQTNDQHKDCIVRLGQAVELWDRFTQSDFAVNSRVDKYPIEWSR